MKTDVRRVVMECFFDLGITIVYASLVGLVIVAVVASDDGRGSLIETLCYTALLPASVVALILLEIALRLIKERRALRKRRRGRPASHLRSDGPHRHEILGQVG